MMDVGQNVKMNEDDEWISIDKIIRDINRDMKLAVETERRDQLPCRSSGGEIFIQSSCFR